MNIRLEVLMRLLDKLMYDPRKFFGAVIIFLWALPIVIVGIISVSAGAMSNDNGFPATTTGGGKIHYATTGASKENNSMPARTANNACDTDGDSAHPDSDDSRSCPIAGKQVKHENAQTATNCGCQQPKPSATHSSANCGCRQSQPAVTHTQANCTCQQPAQPATHAPAPRPKVIERTKVKIVPQKTTIVRTIPQQPAAAAASASAAAAANAVVNVASQPQAAAVGTTNSGDNNAAAEMTTPAVDTSASTNVVYQAQPTSTVSYGKTLPNTGAGSVISVAAVSTVVAGLAHYLYRRRIS